MYFWLKSCMSFFIWIEKLGGVLSWCFHLSVWFLLLLGHGHLGLFLGWCRFPIWGWVCWWRIGLAWRYFCMWVPQPSNWISPNLIESHQSHRISQNLIKSCQISPHLTESNHIFSNLTKSYQMYQISTNFTIAHQITLNLTKSHCIALNHKISPYLTDSHKISPKVNVRGGLDVGQYYGGWGDIF